MLFISQLLTVLRPDLALTGSLVGLPSPVVVFFFVVVTLVALRGERPHTANVPGHWRVLGTYLVLGSFLYLALPEPTAHWSQLPAISALLSAYIVVVTRTSPEELHQGLHVALAGAFFLLLGSLAFEYLAREPLLALELFGTPGGQVHVVDDGGYLVLHGVLGNSNETGGALVCLIPAFYMGIRPLPGLLHSLGLSALGAAVFLLFVTQSTTAIIALGVVCIVMFRNSRPARPILALSPILLFVIRTPPSGETLASAIQNKFNLSGSSTLTIRIWDIWVPAIQDWASGGWAVRFVGYGPNGWFENPAGLVYSDFFGKLVVLSPHSLWIYLLYSLGILGLSVFVIVVLGGVHSALGLNGASRDAGIASLAALCLWGTTANVHNTYGLMLFLVLVLWVDTAYLADKCHSPQDDAEGVRRRKHHHVNQRIPKKAWRGERGAALARAVPRNLSRDG